LKLIAENNSSDLELERKKTAVFGFVALGVGVLGLIGSGAVGWLSYDTKTNAETTNETVIALEDKVNTFLAKNTDKEIDTLKASVEQLNQKVEKMLSEQAAAAQAQAAAATAAENGKASEAGESTKKPAELTKTGTPVNLSKQ
jgi:cell division protein FtsB